LFIADVHGAAGHLAEAAGGPHRMVILGDLINLVDYRTMDGILAEVLGARRLRELVRLRNAGRVEEARSLWARAEEEEQVDLRQKAAALIDRAYAEVLAPLAGQDAVLTFGNSDRIESLQRHLPEGNSFVSHGVVEIEGWRIGIMGGGVKSSLTVPGELSEDEMSSRLAELEGIEILATHVPPAVAPLATDTVGGTFKGSEAVRDYIERHQPPFHYFGDIHQPQALTWTLGTTVCINAGYFRATGRGAFHPPRR
jgi:Icc-related predicted phosphoesterase